jgi:hypothetical protein
MGSMLDKVALGQVSSEYLGFPCQFSFHRMLHIHLSLGAGTTGPLLVGVPNDSISRPPTNKKWGGLFTLGIKYPQRWFRQIIFAALFMIMNRFNGISHRDRINPEIMLKTEFSNLLKVTWMSSSLTTLYPRPHSRCSISGIILHEHKRVLSSVIWRHIVWHKLRENFYQTTRRHIP